MYAVFIKNMGVILGLLVGIGFVIGNVYVIGTGCFNCGWLGLSYCGDVRGGMCSDLQDSILASLLQFPYVLISLVVPSYLPFTTQIGDLPVHTHRLVVFGIVFIPFAMAVGYGVQRLVARLQRALRK